MMKKIYIVLLLIFLMAAPAYALSPADAILCKKVVLRAIERTVLVNRVTGEVKYVLRNGEWRLLTGDRKQECQAMYNAQVKILKNASRNKRK